MFLHSSQVLIRMCLLSLPELRMQSFTCFVRQIPPMAIQSSLHSSFMHAGPASSLLPSIAHSRLSRTRSFSVVGHFHSFKTDAPPLSGGTDCSREVSPLGQQQYLLVKHRNGVDDLSRRLRFLGEIGDANSFTDTVEEAGFPGDAVFEGAEAGKPAESATEEAERILGRVSKLDMATSIKEGVQALKEELMTPTPFSPLEGAEAVRFAFVAVLLLFAFWFGNYFVPYMVFKDTVFKKEREDPKVQPSSSLSGTASGQTTEESLIDEFEGQSRKKQVTGFGQRTQKDLKRSRRK